MMRALILNTLLLFSYCIGFSQNKTLIDSLKHQLDHERQDTNRVAIMLKLYGAFWDSPYPDSSKVFAEKALDLATKIDNPKVEFEVLTTLMISLRLKGDAPMALSYGQKALRIAEKIDDPWKKGFTYEQFGLLYMLNLKDYPKAKPYLKQSIQEYEISHDIDRLAGAEIVLSSLYRRMNQLDSMLIYEQIAYERHKSLNKSGQDGRFPMVMGQNHLVLGDYPLALSLFQKAIVANHNLKNRYQIAESLRGLAMVYEKMNLLDSTIYYEKKAIEVASRFDFKQLLISFYKHLADLYEPQNKDAAYQYLKMAWDLNESVNGTQKIIALETTITAEQERQYQAEVERIASQNRVKQYLFLGGLGILLLIAFLLYNNNRQKQKANNLLHRQKQEIDFQRDKAEKALVELQSTQAQLIQSEKLASLGELTAGIAHEIQNPLNFVNNFSELNRELITEMKEEIEKGNYGEVKTIAGDLEVNEERINHHGQRASAIVKGMLEHSRVSTGVKEPTDLNALADEYLRLAYHGLRAKDDNFNATLETHFDPNLPLVSVIPQDIGRVLLNLINNAFYAVAERSRSTVNEKAKQGIESYTPTVTVSTRQLENAIEISVQDNGNGIPEAIKDKIFQPFFTTKPTGQGTGLGLSLAHDIVTKGHGGNLEVKSKGKDGTKFTIQLPVNSKS